MCSMKCIVVGAGAGTGSVCSVQSALCSVLPVTGKYLALKNQMSLVDKKKYISGF